MEMDLVDSTKKETALMKLSKAQGDLVVEEKQAKGKKKQRELVRKEERKQEDFRQNIQKCAQLFVELSPAHFKIKESRLADFKDKEELATLGGKLAQMVQLRAYSSLAAAVIYASGYCAGLISLGILFPIPILVIAGLSGTGGLIASFAIWMSDNQCPKFLNVLKECLAIMSAPIWLPFYLIRCILPFATDVFGKDNTKGALFQFKHFHYLRLCQKLKKMNGQNYFPSDEIMKQLESK